MIRISQDLLDDVANHARREAPEECCGLLLGRRDEAAGVVTVTGLTPSPNVAEGDRTVSFEVSPQLRFNMMRALRGGPDTIVGHYHSHPTGSAEPSATDAAQAWEPDLVWLVTAMEGGQPRETRAWRFNEEAKAFSELPLDISG